MVPSHQRGPRPVPRSFWPDYLKRYAEHGYSALTLKAWRTSVPFTFAEAEHDNSGSQASWIFDFFRRYDNTAGLLGSARFSQKKVLEDELAIAGRKRRTASLAI